MSIVERPNKEALIKAIDIFRDDMRTFLVQSLGQAPARSERVAIEQALRNGQVDSFARNLSRAEDLESAIDVSYVIFGRVVLSYWEEVFKQKLRGRRKFLDNLEKIVEARHRASHPPYRCDLDREYTIGRLCLIAKVLGWIRAGDSQVVVANIRKKLENYDTYGVQDAAIVEAKDKESIAEAAARKDAEQRAEIAEASISKVTVKLQRETEARRDAEELVDLAEASLTKTESDLDVTRGKLKKEKSARHEAEKRTQIAEASLCEAKKEIPMQVAARREAEENAKEEARARQMAERATLEKRTAFEQIKKEFSATKGELRIAQDRIKQIETAYQEKTVFAQHICITNPLDPRTAEYEQWLLDEIFSERLGRAELRALADDNRVSGRLVYFVQAAASDMNGKAWKGYLTGRRKALRRNRKISTFVANQQNSRLLGATHH